MQMHWSATTASQHGAVSGGIGPPRVGPAARIGYRHAAGPASEELGVSAGGSTEWQERLKAKSA